LVAGPKGAGKKTLMWALNHYFVKNGQNLSKKELAQLKFRVDEFDDGVIMTSIPFQGTELIFCVGEILYNWIPIYRKAPAWDLIFCVDVSMASAPREECTKNYDHFHGMLGEAEKETVNVYF